MLAQKSGKGSEVRLVLPKTIVGVFKEALLINSPSSEETSISEINLSIEEDDFNRRTLYT